MQSEFTFASGAFGRVMLPIAVLLVFVFAVLLQIGWMLGGLAVGLVVAFAGTAIPAYGISVKLRALKKSATVQFSAYGVRLTDAKGFQVDLAWPDITAIGPVSRTSAARIVGVQAGTRILGDLTDAAGLIGWGRRAIPDRAPAWQKRRLAAQPTNPQDGRPLVAIPLGAIDPDWFRGPIGEWVRRYRPDLLDQPAQ